MEAFVGIGHCAQVDFWWRFLFFSLFHDVMLTHSLTIGCSIFQVVFFQHLVFFWFFLHCLKSFCIESIFSMATFCLHIIRKCMDKPLQLTTNLTLGGLHMTLTIHDCVEWANPTKNSPKWSCSGKQWWFRNFLLEMPFGMVENFPFQFSNHLGGFSYWSFQAFYIRLTTLYTR